MALATRVTASYEASGCEPVQVLDVLVGITMKTLSNYTNHIAETPLDPAFARRRWNP